ncbi:MAG: hypothetical protein EPO21_18490 [Chloroflexota bacterium]|nr:MAG: hypothetical protein EPO21_18490 [Chloroflexota bacterium]
MIEREPQSHPVDADPSRESNGPAPGQTETILAAGAISESLSPAQEAEAANLDSISRILKASVQERQDVVLGRCQRFDVLAAQLELYPDRGLVRYRRASLQLDVANVSRVGIEKSWLRVEGGDQASRTVLFLHPNGSLTLTVVPDDQPAPAQTTAPEAAANEVLPPQQLPSPADNANAESATSEPPAQKLAQPEKPERVVITGRVGRVPELRETPNGHFVARMPLAIHTGEKTVWHTVLFFDDQAKQAAATRTKGEVITVIGYKHLRTIPTKNGTKQVEQIFAAAVQTPKPAKKS